MKKIILTVIITIITSNLFAQKANVQSALIYLKDNNIEKAKEAIDKAAENSTTSNYYKMWYYKGMTYYKIHVNKKFKHLDATALEKATESFLNFSKTYKKGWPELEKNAHKHLLNCAHQLFNKATIAYNNEDFKNAKRLYNMIFTILPHDKENNLARNNISEEILYYRLYLNAEREKNLDNAKDYLTKLIDANYNDPKIYIYMSRILIQEKDTIQALSYIEKGRAIFDEDIGLIKEEIDIYIKQKKTEVLINKLTQAINTDTEFEQLYFIRGTIYNEKDDFTNAEQDYKKAIEIKPDYFSALYNLGVLYYNQAVKVNDKMNKLTLKQQKEYDRLKTERDRYFAKAIPGLNKVIELDPEDINSLTALGHIYARMGLLEKSNEYKKRIKEIEERVETK